MRFALNHEHVRATGLSEMISDTRTNDAAAYDDDVRGFHKKGKSKKEKGKSKGTKRIIPGNGTMTSSGRVSVRGTQVKLKKLIIRFSIAALTFLLGIVATPNSEPCERARGNLPQGSFVATRCTYADSSWVVFRHEAYQSIDTSEEGFWTRVGTVKVIDRDTKFDKK